MKKETTAQMATKGIIAGLVFAVVMQFAFDELVKDKDFQDALKALSKFYKHHIEMGDGG